MSGKKPDTNNERLSKRLLFDAGKVFTMTDSAKTGVLLMSYGTPKSQEDIEAFYTDVRRGRPPSREQLDELVQRYELIGGTSPLTKKTYQQIEAISSRLDSLSPGKYLVVYGTKHSSPKIEEAVQELADAKVSSLIGMVFAPHYSRFSIGEYLERAQKVAAASEIKCRFIKSFALDGKLLDFLTDQIRSELNKHINQIVLLRKSRTFGDSLSSPDKIMILITAHSLPRHLVTNGDPYIDELNSTAAAIAKKLGLGSESEFVELSLLKDKLVEKGDSEPERERFDLLEDIEISWQIAWQSAGKTDQEWLGPDILTVIKDLSEREITDVIICPAGFMADHLEVLYDIDIDGQKLAKNLGVALSRTESVNDNLMVMNSLAEKIHELAADFDSN